MRSLPLVNQPLQHFELTSHKGESRLRPILWVIVQLPRVVSPFWNKHAAACPKTKSEPSALAERDEPMNRTTRYLAITLLLALGSGAPGVQAQTPAAANQSTASTAQSPLTAEVPRLIKFAGTLLDAQDRAMAGPAGVTFALYSQQTGGAALWLETQNVKPDANGAYTVLLGANSANGVPAELFASGEARWLEVQVERQAEQPRVLLVSVPYALKAKDAETLGGKPASAFVTTETLAGAGNPAGASAPSSSTASTSLPISNAQSTPKRAASAPQPAVACTSVTSGGAAAVNSISMFTTACNVESSVITQLSGNVGVGITAPAYPLDVFGNNASMRVSGTGTHALVVTGSLSSGRLGQDGTGFFFSSDTNGKVIKFATNNGTLNERMRITSDGNVGIGTSTPADKLDVIATAAGATGLSVQATDLTTANTAVSGLANGLNGAGVFGEAENGSLAFGVWGRSASGVAGQFDGKVNVTGTLTKAGGSFKIDHPIDPSNKYLYHSFVESPDMKNIYDGVVNLDTQGEAVVQLPGWFGTLNKEFRYQLTCIGGFAPVYIAEEISENRFKIAGGNPGMKVSWMVTGIRQDAWANAHRIPVEEEKPPRERGYYLHPELYGQPPQKSTSWAQHPDVMKKKGQAPGKLMEPKQ